MKFDKDAKYYAAADLGASSGRVILGALKDGQFDLHELHRFPNGPMEENGTIRWDIRGLFDSVKEGFNKAIAFTEGSLRSVAIDTWGVDYGQIDDQGQLLQNPYHYRDSRTEEPFQSYPQFIEPAELYRLSGLQPQAYNTIFQLMAAAGDKGWDRTKHLLFTPDLLSYFLTGRAVAEVTIASTSGLLDAAERQWSGELITLLRDRFGIPVPQVLGELVEPGTVIGLSSPNVLEKQVEVVAVGSHDTASAVASVPASSSNFAFISSGTWSLVGMELDSPVVTEASMNSKLTNELGVGGTVRYLQNIMGMWVFNECRREWASEGKELSFAELDAQAAKATPLGCVIDINDERLFTPGPMLSRLRDLAAESGQVLPQDPGGVLRCIDDSLALAYRDAIRHEEQLSGKKAEAIHIVGGGSKNALLCQLTAESVNVPVIAGPTEGTALGNLLLQAQALGDIEHGNKALREVAMRSVQTKEYRPGILDISLEQWDAAKDRITKGLVS